MQVDDVFSRKCPVCGKGKLSYMKYYKQGSDACIRVYPRKCDRCGAEVVDKVVRTREVTQPVDQCAGSGLS